MHSAQHIVCANQEGVAVLRQRGYKGTTSVIPLAGVDTRVFHPHSVAWLRAQLGLADFVVGYIGRLVSEKGIDLLIDAVAQINLPIDILIVGSGPARAALQAQAVRCAISHRVHFVEHVPQDQVGHYMNLLDVLALPSRATTHWMEQFGRVLAEAMACRVVVAGSNSGAIPEVIGEAGFIFPENDSVQLAGFLRRVASDYDYRTMLAARGEERVQLNYTTEQIAARTLSVWRSVLD